MCASDDKMSERSARDSVTILGTGAMGSAIASHLLDKGMHVTVWNRSREKAARLESLGSDVAPTAAVAIAASPIVLSCLLNTSVLDRVLDDPEAAEPLPGKTVVDTSTASPHDVIALGSRLARAGALQLDAKLMFYPARVGSSDAVIYVSGPESLYRRNRGLFEAIAGKAVLVGEEISAASLMYNAVWTYYYAGLFGFLEASAFVRASGLDARTFLNLALESTRDLSEHLREATDRIDRQDFDGDQAALEIYVDGFHTMERAFADVGVPSQILETLRLRSQMAVAAGYGRSDVSAIHSVLLPNDGSNNVHAYGDGSSSYVND